VFTQKKIDKINIQLFGAFDEAANQMIKAFDEPQPGPEPSPESTPQPEQEPTPQPEPQPQDQPKDNDPEPEPKPQPQEKSDDKVPFEPDEPEFDIKDFITKVDTKLDEVYKKIDESQQLPQPQKTPEELEAEAEAKKQELLDRLMENPEAVLKEFYEEQRKIEKKQEEEAQRKAAEEREKFEMIADEFLSNNPDAVKYIDDMAKIINSYDFLKQNEKSLEIAYRMAKGEKFDSVRAEYEKLSKQPKTIEEIIADEENFNKLIQNEKIFNAVVEKYIKDIGSGKAPFVISNGGSTGKPPVSAPTEKPKSFKAATEAFLKSWQ
jgi:hypothetical protein